MTPSAPLKSTERSIRQTELSLRSPSILESPSVDASARRKQRLEAKKRQNPHDGLGLGLPDSVAEKRPPRLGAQDVSGDEGGAGTTTKVQASPLNDDRMAAPPKKQAQRKTKMNTPKRTSQRIQNKKEAKRKQGARAAEAVADDESSAFVIIGNGAPPSYHPAREEDVSGSSQDAVESNAGPRTLPWLTTTTTVPSFILQPTHTGASGLANLRFKKTKRVDTLHPSLVLDAAKQGQSTPTQGPAGPLDGPPVANSTPAPERAAAGATEAPANTTNVVTPGRVRAPVPGDQTNPEPARGGERLAQSLDYEDDPTRGAAHDALAADDHEIISVHDSSDDDDDDRAPHADDPSLADDKAESEDQDEDIVMADQPEDARPSHDETVALNAGGPEGRAHTAGASRAALMRAAATASIPPPLAKAAAFPEIHVHNFGSLHTNQCPEQMQEWLDKIEDEQKILLCTVAGRGVDDYGSYDVNKAVNRIIRAYLQSALPEAIAATAVVEQKKANSPPYWYQVQHLSRPQFLRLKEKRGLYAEGFYIGFVDWTSVPTKLLGAWHKCNRMIDLTVPRVVKAFRTALRASDEAKVMRNIIKSDLGGDAADAAAVSQRFDEVIESIDARVLESKNKDQVTDPVVVFYMDPPTQDAVAWEALRERIRANVRPGDRNAGKLEYLKEAEDWKCRTCHGADHPSGFCLVPDTAGWKEPAAVVADFKTEQTTRETKVKREESNAPMTENRPKGPKRNREGKPQSNAKGRKGRGV